MYICEYFILLSDISMVSLGFVVLALLLSVFVIQTCAGTFQDYKFNAEQELSDGPIRRFLNTKISEKSLIYRICKSLKMVWDLVKRFILGSYSQQLYTKRPNKYRKYPKRKRLFPYWAFPKWTRLYPNRLYKQGLYPQQKRLHPNRAYSKWTRLNPQRTRLYSQQKRLFRSGIGHTHSGGGLLTAALTKSLQWIASNCFNIVIEYRFEKIK